jgi:hypothetical protein
LPVGPFPEKRKHRPVNVVAQEWLAVAPKLLYTPLAGEPGRAQKNDENRCLIELSFYRSAPWVSAIDSGSVLKDDETSFTSLDHELAFKVSTNV